MMKIKTELLQALIKNFPAGGLEQEISFDTRTISKGAIFIALNGENFKAASFVSRAFEEGASFAVVNEEDREIIEEKYLENCFFEKDTTIFIKSLSSLALSRWRSKGKVVIGITGSNGKTSTKELLVHMLKNLDVGEVRGTEGNLNNHIGVPMSVFKLEDSDKVAVFEIGTNNFGEIRYLSEIIKPDIAVITSIGQSHLESFGNERAVFSEKIDLFYETIQNSDRLRCCFFHSHDEYLNDFEPKDRCFISDDTSSGLVLSNISNESLDFSFMGQSYKFSFKHLFGKHHYLNLLNCFSLIVEVFNITPISVLESAKNFKLGSYRGEWKKIKDFDCFLDCYNSNPSSLRASLDSFTAKYKEKIDQTLFVIGDMYELGEESNSYHEAAGKYLQELSLANVIFIGERAKSFEKGFGQKLQHFKSVDDVTLSQLELTNISTLYLKGSRGVQLEKLLEIFNK